ncbi:RNA-binding protein [Malaciobacter mytili LMG 24559]|uniref:RNA-binding protein n=1 Tax=Malaciobacter mytili LMG 24559 TaxID=1032238 RepID=A0AAX2AER1_9BACT|nr:Tex-like N-terminal domain-containing protein [Malaciobacter mytili]AXH14666.1 transcriptional accessory protein Tex [Malaciobacter mytili LMG 24559]RXK15125.1 RNA-binding protein [Malaciobacter mytili LMG 24559]
MNKIIETIKLKTSMQEKYIKNILKLLEEGCTIPFIARYRKDLTGNATDEQLREFSEIYEYSKKLEEKKEEIKQNLLQKEVLTSQLELQINQAKTLVELDDIYSVFKVAKSSRTLKALENNLEGLANIIQSMKYNIEEIKQKAKTFLNENIKNEQEAIDGAKDIIAQRYADDLKSKEIIRNILENHALLECKATKTFEEEGVYKLYKEFSQKVKFIPSYRVLAILRAVSEKQISVKVEIDETQIIENIKKYKIPSFAKESSIFVLEAYIDGLKRLLLPSLKREVLTNLKEKASNDAIVLFGKNLHQLLITPPVVNQVILGVDPGYKTGCKICVIDEDAKFLDSAVIYPTKPQEDYENSAKTILALIKKYKVSAVAIGNGTASNETASFFARLIKENSLELKFAVVSEIGASVYSASKIANIEYPNLDVTIKGAISIASRLRDPLSALVKIDAKSLGVGQYQHDVNQTKLEKKLNEVTEDLVNKVGVDLNSASYKLLSFVSAISLKLAQNIVEYRQVNGKFKTKSELLKVKGIGSKAYEQAVGFLRIKDGLSILDNTAVHPENYNLAKDLLTQGDLKAVNKQEFALKYNVSIQTCEDVIKELLKPGFDIREELPATVFRDDEVTLESLKQGDELSGVVRNLTDFGAFVDVGLKNDGMIHISKMSEKRISHPMEVLSINQYLPRIKVESIDRQRAKVSLSLI